MYFSLTRMELRLIQMENQGSCHSFSRSVDLVWIAKYDLKLFRLHHDNVCTGLSHAYFTSCHSIAAQVSDSLWTQSTELFLFLMTLIIIY